jgi:hypothetical protein
VTLTLQVPAVGEFIGAGRRLVVSTDILGPFANGSSWTVAVRQLPTTNLIALETQPVDLTRETTLDYTFGFRGGGVLDYAAFGAAFGADVQISVTLVDGFSGSPIDGPTNFITYAWDPVGSLPLLLNQLVSAQSSGSFTDQDRSALLGIYRSTAAETYSTLLAHPGLTDNGFLNLQPGTAAIRVTIQAFPPDVSVDPGTPEYFFNVGFITINDIQGFVKSARLVFEFQTYKLPSSRTGLGWTLRPGAQIMIEELQVTG